MLTALFSAAVANAQSIEPREQARQHYSHGLELSGHGDYRLALEEFLAAYRISPNFAVLYNIGQAYVALGRPSDAAAALEQYLKDGKDQIPAERAAQTAAQIAAQKAQLAEITVRVDAPGSSIRVDGQPVGDAPLSDALRVAPGAHVITVALADHQELTRSVTVQPGQHLDLQFEATPSATEAKPTGSLGVVCSEPVQIWVDGMSVIGPAANPRISLDAGHRRVVLGRHGHRSAEHDIDIQPSSSVILECAERLQEAPGRALLASASSRRITAIGLVTGGLGVALGAAAVGHYLWNRGRYEDWKGENSALLDPSAANRHQRQIDNNDLAASIDRASRVTVSLALGGGALLATGTTLIVVGAGSPKEDRHASFVSAALCGVW